MKKLFVLMLAFAAFSAGVLSPAQERKSISIVFVGKVTQADERTKAVTMVGKDGEKVTLNFSNSKPGTCPRGRKPPQWVFPKVGDVFVARISNECDDCLATC